MKKILTVSLVAIMAATAANADIASTKYVTDRTGTTADLTTTAKELTGAVNELKTKLDTVTGEGEGSVAEQITDALTSYTNTEGMNSAISTAVSGAKQELTTEIGEVDDKADANAEAISNLDQTYATDEQATAAATAATDALNLTAVGATGSFISSVSQSKGTVSATPTAFESKIDDTNKDSAIAPQTKAVKTYVDAQISTVSQLNSNEISEVAQSVSDLSDTVAANKTAADTAIQEAKDDAAQALTDAKAYADSQDAAQTTAITTAYQAADSALKTELEGKITSAAGDANAVADDLAEYITANDAAVEAAQTAADNAQADLDAYKTSNNTAVAAAKKAGDDAQADLNAYKTSNDAAVAKAKTDAESVAKAYTDGEIDMVEAAYAAADTALETSLQSYADQAELDAIAAAKAAGDDTYQAKSSALSVGAANGAWTDLTAATGYSTTGTHSLVLKNGVIQWELVDYGDNQ